MSGNRSFLSRVLPLTDLILALCCAHVAPEVTNFLAPYVGWKPVLNFNVFTVSPFMVGAAIAAVPVILRVVGFYHRQNQQRIASALRQLLAFAIYCLGFFGFYQIVDEGGSSVYMNHVILVSLLLTVIALFLRYYLLLQLQLRTGRGRKNLRRVLLACTEADADREWESFPLHWRKRFKVAGRIIAGKTTQEEVQQLIEQHNVDQLILFGGLPAYHIHEETITRCELQGIDVYVHLRDTHLPSLRADITDIGEQHVLILSSTPVRSWAMLLKDFLDKIMAFTGILLTSPLWLIAAIGIKLSDPKGKIFYRQQRSGLYGTPFGMWKFRSMYSDADKRLDEIKAKYGNEMSGPIFKLTNDPRIFPFGHFIRKYSIDELPQLINVLTGDMSIVGPRPLPTYETEAFPEIAQRRRLSVKPGLTCYWQIEDRSDNQDFDVLVNKDLKYIDNWNLWTDFVLILRTIPVAIFGKGAK